MPELNFTLSLMLQSLSSFFWAAVLMMLLLYLVALYFTIAPWRGKGILRAFWTTHALFWEDRLSAKQGAWTVWGLESGSGLLLGPEKRPAAEMPLSPNAPPRTVFLVFLCG